MEGNVTTDWVCLNLQVLYFGEDVRGQSQRRRRRKREIKSVEAFDRSPASAGLRAGRPGPSLLCKL